MQSKYKRTPQRVRTQKKATNDARGIRTFSNEPSDEPFCHGNASHRTCKYPSSRRVLGFRVTSSNSHITEAEMGRKHTIGVFPRLHLNHSPFSARAIQEEDCPSHEDNPTSGISTAPLASQSPSTDSSNANVRSNCYEVQAEQEDYSNPSAPLVQRQWCYAAITTWTAITLSSHSTTQAPIPQRQWWYTAAMFETIRSTISQPMKDSPSTVQQTQPHLLYISQCRSRKTCTDESDSWWGSRRTMRATGTQWVWRRAKTPQLSVSESLVD